MRFVVGDLVECVNPGNFNQLEKGVTYQVKFVSPDQDNMIGIFHAKREYLSERFKLKPLFSPCYAGAAEYEEIMSLVKVT